MDTPDNDRMTVCYLRVAHADTDRVQQQAEACETWAEEAGDFITRYYIDNGVSGSADADRPQFNDLLDDAEAGKIGRVIIFSMDRISRSVLEGLRVLQDLDKSGVEVCSVSDPGLDGTPQGRLVTHFMLSLAEMEREQRSIRARYAARHASEVTA